MLDENGDTRCPNCGAVNSIGQKGGLAQNLLNLLTIGDASLRWPNRVRCDKCGIGLTAPRE